MSRSGQVDHGLEALLSLHGEEFVFEGGYLVRFSAWLVERSDAVPHGLRYSLTLHDRSNRRVLGFDNAHSVNVRKRRFEPRSRIRDHWHVGDKTHEYRYENAAKLLQDFLEQVNQQMNRND